MHKISTFAMNLMQFFCDYEIDTISEIFNRGKNPFFPAIKIVGKRLERDRNLSNTPPNLQISQYFLVL